MDFIWNGHYLTMPLDTTTCALLTEADLRPFTTEVEDQLQYDSCLGNAGASLFEILVERLIAKWPDMGWQFTHLSRFYLYWWLRNFGLRTGMKGGSPADLMDVLHIKGVPPESMWPYIEANLDAQPPVECDVAARAYRIVESANLCAGTSAGNWALAAEQTRTNMKHAICQGRPVLVSIMITEDYRTQWRKQAGQPWQKFGWDWRPSSTNPIIGGHEMLLDGFSDAAGGFMSEGSWGKGGGDGGFARVPYELVADLSWGMTSAYCSLKDTIGNIPLDGYVPIVYPEAEQQGIRDAVAHFTQPLTDAAKQYAIPGARIDSAMKWPVGSATRFLNL